MTGKSARDRIAITAYYISPIAGRVDGRNISIHCIRRRTALFSATQCPRFFSPSPASPASSRAPRDWWPARSPSESEEPAPPGIPRQVSAARLGPPPPRSKLPAFASVAISTTGQHTVQSHNYPEIAKTHITVITHHITISTFSITPAAYISAVRGWFDITGIVAITTSPDFC